LALKLNIEEGEAASGNRSPARLGSTVEGLPGGLLRPGISPQGGA